jgi:DNA-binding SARP family transcriptional activator/tetratricopeptide (TPR) repeat protein
MTDPDDPLRFGLLGPLQGWRGVTALPLGPIQQQVMLAVLLLHANRPLSRSALMEAIWGVEAPASAVHLVQRHASGLRRVLGNGQEPSRRLVWTHGGYLLTVEDDETDLGRFERQVAQARHAREAGDEPGAAKGLRAALELWRGPLCEGLSSPLLDAERSRLAEGRVSVLEQRIALDLVVGDATALIPELRRLVVDHPLRERLRGLLMQALCGAGRQAEALAAFQDTRRTLRDELGIEPGRELQELHQRVLRADPTLWPAPAWGTSAGAASRPRPAQLPRGVPHFTGREEELDRLGRMITDEPGGVALIVGTAGVGKTALALHTAHRARAAFPDGQLHVNLRGFDPTRAAMDPAEGLQGFLEALGVPPDQMPSGVTAQSALYRTLVQDRRLLVLLDNARDAAQVRPLLPGASTTQVIVTSRNSLSGLVAEVGAQPLILDVLAPAEARRLLASRLGADRVDAEPQAVDEILRTCAGLPLALAIVSARGVAQPRFPLAALARQLRVSTDGLDVFVDDDELTDVRAVISWSYKALPDEAARLFRLMSVHPGPDITIPTAASLLARPAAAARSAMVTLCRAHLVEERSPGRFGFHDLLRAYAAEKAAGTDSEPERPAALHRVLAHYLGTAHAADLLLSPGREPLAPVSEAAGVLAVDLTDRRDALDWFVAELPALFAVVDHASSTDLDFRTWDLVWGLETFLDRRGQWHEREYGEAYRRYAGALQQAQSSGDSREEARLHSRLNWVLERLGRFDEGLEHARRALDLFTALGHRAGVAHSMNAIGWCHAQLGAGAEALRWCEAALRLSQELGQRDSEAHTWDSLGYAHDLLGAPRTAVACYRHALDLWRELGVRTYEADTMERMAKAYEADGNGENATRVHHAAAQIRADLLAHRWP